MFLQKDTRRKREISSPARVHRHTLDRHNFLFDKMEIYPNEAALERGAYVTTSDGFSCNDRDVILSTATDDSKYAEAPIGHTLFIHFPFLRVIDTLVVRLYYKDHRTYTFAQFESSEDGELWREILPPGSQRKQTFEVHFAPRRIKVIRVRATNTSNDYLHIVRFQAFNFSNPAIAFPPAPPVAGPVGHYA